MNLGQVYTKASVAQYMVSLFTLPEGAKVLDPCFGKGVFLDALNKDARYIIEGIEIDKKNYDFYLHRAPKHCTLHHGDFFSTDCKLRFDGIIMNPPYIRQEDIDSLREYGIYKERLRKKVGTIVDSKANLYMYFLIYALKLLKDQGELIAIFPNSWEKSKSGEAFKKAIGSMCMIEQHISVDGEPFIGSPIVKVNILKFKKTDRKGATLYKEILAEGEIIHEIMSEHKDETSFQNTTSLSEYAQICRGKTTGSNSIFINPDISSDVHLCDILSSPKSVKGFSTTNAKADKYLFIPDKNIVLDAETKSYIESCTNRIIHFQSPESLYRIARKSPYWYVSNSICTGDILFPYIIRRSVRFILNDRGIPARDNFYLIRTSTDKLLMMALLNNHFIWYQLEKCGKTYGNNVLKIQKYDVDNLLIIKPETISLDDKKKLKTCAKTLVETSDEGMIAEITSILAKYYNTHNIEDILNEIRKKRLGK